MYVILGTGQYVAVLWFELVTVRLIQIQSLSWSFFIIIHIFKIVLNLHGLRETSSARAELTMKLDSTIFRQIKNLILFKRCYK